MAMSGSDTPSRRSNFEFRAPVGAFCAPLPAHGVPTANASVGHVALRSIKVVAAVLRRRRLER